MTRDDLYINGVKADLGKTDISLKYKSNLLTDISKIVSNSSYTIKLPKTAKNMALIKCSHIPSSTSRYPYLKHKGTVLRNGIEIIKDANVVLLETGEFIEVALTWGNVTNFASVVNDGKKLTDISYGTVEGVDWIVWNNKGSNSGQFPLIDYGFNSGDPNVWYHPVVTVKWILDKIQEESGVAFNFPPDKLTVINKMIVPLLTRSLGYKAILEFYNIVDTRNTKNIVSFTTDSGSNKYITYANDDGGKDTTFIISKIDNINIDFKGKIVIVSKCDNPSKLYMIIASYWSMSIYYNIYPYVEDLGNEYYKFSFTIDNSISDVLNGHRICFAIRGANISNIKTNDSIGNIQISFLNTQLKLNGDYYFVPNLPDIKQIDFIKAVASMVGLFALPDGTNGIKFIPFDSLSANKSKAVDWTSRVIMAYRSVTPRSLKYTLDNIAQNNWFRYKEDDKVTGNYDGNIQVEDATIDYERDAIKLPFSACDTKNGVAYIPLYSYNDKGELQYNKANPRILLLNGTKGVFIGMQWTTLIANNYQTYKGLINNAKVVTEYIRLNSIELRDLEMDVPVYLAQYGCYLAIVEIKTRDNDICECKLLKL